ncbi:GNAT family N-acetyltransferase [Myxococcota bacterium]|nr:GNAT family N-acetyltransferase [Myxococcota bacterium]MBU1413592.1 GNAT family N-acetyltransferase [Myxococcota bacterium]MBU1509488.1 GNAT family N-acetyltransferase [Myxococcota bacterium]
MNRDEHVFTIRETVLPTDPDSVLHIVVSTGFFNAEEIQIAVELVDENLQKGAEKSGYHFVFMECRDEVMGYSCYGRIPGTLTSYDLYWIAIGKRWQRLGLGHRMMTATEERIRAAGGHQIFIETSSTDLYHPTHVFYEHCRYSLDHVFPDFYAPGDSKYVYVKRLVESSEPVEPGSAD